MSEVWNAATYDIERRRLIYCFDDFYGTAAELVARFCPRNAHVLDLGAGTGLLSATIVARVPTVSLSLLDESAEMLLKAEQRLERFKPKIDVQSLMDPLPPGPYDAIVSALAIHHLSDDDKKNLYRRILDELMPGGIFINAEQVAGRSARLTALNESVHLECARELGSSEDEIRRAVERMTHDQCVTVEEQVSWLQDCGFEDADCIYRSFRFAVIVAWRGLT